jgi:hypothetical protein
MPVAVVTHQAVSWPDEAEAATSATDSCTPAESAAVPAATVHHADIFTWQAPRNDRGVSAWDSIWHVGLEQQHDLMLKLPGLLEPGGVLIFTAGGLDGPSEHADAIMGRPTDAPRSAYPDCFGSSTKPVACCAICRSSSCRSLTWSWWPSVWPEAPVISAASCGQSPMRPT